MQAWRQSVQNEYLSLDGWLQHLGHSRCIRIIGQCNGRFNVYPEGLASRRLVSAEARELFTNVFGVTEEFLWSSPRESGTIPIRRNDLIVDRKKFVDQGDQD